MNHIKETVAELERHLEKLRIDATAIERVLVILKKKDCPKTVPSPVQKADPVKKAKKPKQKKKKRKTSPTRSKYKGVITVLHTDGSITYRANYWDAVGKKTKHEGTYDNELEAASAVQKALGNGEEAQGLLDKAMKESGTSTPPTKTTERYFRCKHCKLETKTRPVQCMNCNGASFDGPLTRELED